MSKKRIFYNLNWVSINGQIVSGLKDSDEEKIGCLGK